MPASIPAELRQRIWQATRAAEHDRSAGLTVGSLAEFAGVSDKHFQRAFRVVVGESPKRYVRRIRLQSAAYLLKWSDLPITDVALQAGFDTHAGFSKAFAKAYGQSPQQFRRDTGVTPYLRVRAPSGDTGDGEPAGFEAAKLTVRIEQTPPTRVAAMRHVGPAEKLPEVWPRMTAWARSRGLLDDESMLLGIHNDYWDANAEDRYRYDAAIVVPDDFEADPEVTTFSIPAGEVAMVEFAGSIAEADVEWRRFVDQWLPLSGYAIRTNYAYDRYPVEIATAGPLKSLLQTLTGLRATLCLPISRP